MIDQKIIIKTINAFIPVFLTGILIATIGGSLINSNLFIYPSLTSRNKG